MMILTGRQIESEVSNGRIVIEDFSPRRLEPNSYGFRLADEIVTYDQDVVDCLAQPAHRQQRIGPDGLVLEPGRLYLGSTMESMGSTAYASFLYARRSVACLGMWIQFSAPLGHSGAIFPWTLEIAVAQSIRVYRGMPIGKIAFCGMAGTPMPYAGKYQGSLGTVVSRLSEDWAMRTG